MLINIFSSSLTIHTNKLERFSAPGEPIEVFLFKEGSYLTLNDLGYCVWVSEKMKTSLKTLASAVD